MPTLLAALAYGGAVTAGIGFFSLSAMLIRSIAKG